mmetsp:Transcript_56761/g.133250  ORF Transcript_56761/g.133250 Transcript_56761/m.133250 type:complete len:228 (+) Transcript_56761:3711-4394(+)
MPSCVVVHKWLQHRKHEICLGHRSRNKDRLKIFYCLGSHNLRGEILSQDKPVVLDSLNKGLPIPQEFFLICWAGKEVLDAMCHDVLDVEIHKKHLQQSLWCRLKVGGGRHCHLQGRAFLHAARNLNISPHCKFRRGKIIERGSQALRNSGPHHWPKVVQKELVNPTIHCQCLLYDILIVHHKLKWRCNRLRQLYVPIVSSGVPLRFTHARELHEELRLLLLLQLVPA